MSVTFRLNCRDRVFLAHLVHWQHFQSVLLSLVAGQTEHLPSHLPPPLFTVVGEAVYFQGTPTALNALRVRVLTFPLSAFHLICGLNHFFLLGKADGDIFDCSFVVSWLHLVDLGQVCSPTCLPGCQNPLLL